MKNRLFIWVVVLFVQLAHGAFNTSITGGAAMAIGPGSSDWNPGYGANFTLLAKPVKYFGIGGDINYDLWIKHSKSEDSPNQRSARHYFSLSLLLRTFIPFSEEVNLFFEAGDGIYLKISRITDKMSHTRNYFDPLNGVGGGWGLTIKVVEVRNTFTYLVGKSVRSKWISLSLGISF